MEKTNEQLWQEYHDMGSEEARIALYENNRGIIIDCAKRWQHSYGAKNIEFEDLYGEIYDFNGKKTITIGGSIQYRQGLSTALWICLV